MPPPSVTLALRHTKCFGKLRINPAFVLPERGAHSSSRRLVRVTLNMEKKPAAAG